MTRLATIVIGSCVTAMLVAAGAAAHGVGMAPDPTARGQRAGRLETFARLEDDVVVERLDREQSTWLRRGGGAVDLATRDIVRFGECPPWPVGPAVLLTDGGVVAGTIEAADAGRVAVRSPCLGRLDLPAGFVTGYRRSQATGPRRLRRAAPPGDIHLTNGDVSAGLPGPWRDGELVLETSGGRVAIPARLIQAVDFPSAPPPGPVAPRTRLLVALADGSRLPVAALRPAADPDRFEIAIDVGHAPGAGGDGPSPGQAFVTRCDRADVAAVVVDGGIARLLASLPPADYAQRPIIGPAWPLAVHHTLSGDWPAAGGTTGFSSLGIHAPATVAFRLERPAVRFRARVAIDASAAGRGAVILRVRARPPTGDWQEAFRSSIVRGGDPPLDCDVDLAGAVGIELAVEAADEADVLARTIWIDPHVVMAP